MNFAQLLALLIALPATYVERDIETQAARSTRMQEVASVLAEYQLDMQRKLIAKGYGETTFAAYTRNVCSDVPKGGSDCDRGRARSYWQLHSGACPELWQASDADAVRVAAACAARRLGESFRRCKTPEQAFAHFGNWRCVPTENSKRKAALYRRLRGE